MKNVKKILAALGVLVVLLGALLPLIFSLRTGEDSANWFWASIAVAFFLPVLLYAILFMAKFYQNRQRKDLSSHSIDTIIFDVGNVLVDYNWQDYLDSFHFPEEERDTLAKVIFQSENWNLRDKGTVSDEKVIRNMIAEAPQYEKDIRRVFRDSYKTVSRRDYAETWVKYLKEQGYKTYILSNYGTSLLDQTRHLIPVKQMDGAVFSCDVNAIKPDPAIYEILLERFGINPERAVFLDDRQENLDGAAKFGIHTILFQDFKQAAKDLEKLGIH